VAKPLAVFGLFVDKVAAEESQRIYLQGNDDDPDEGEDEGENEADEEDDDEDDDDEDE